MSVEPATFLRASGLRVTTQRVAVPSALTDHGLVRRIQPAWSSSRH